MTILGIDPGLAAVGWGLVREQGGHLVHVASGCSRTAAGPPLSWRVDAQAARIGSLLREYEPDAVAIEDYEDQGPRTHRAAGQAIGVVRVLEAVRQEARAVGCVSPLYAPALWKPAIRGRGWAMREAVGRRLAMTPWPRSEHAADALGVAIYHAFTLRLAARAAVAGGPR